MHTYNRVGNFFKNISYLIFFFLFYIINLYPYCFFNCLSIISQFTIAASFSLRAKTIRCSTSLRTIDFLMFNYVLRSSAKNFSLRVQKNVRPCRGKTTVFSSAATIRFPQIMITTMMARLQQMVEKNPSLRLLASLPFPSRQMDWTPECASYIQKCTAF